MTNELVCIKFMIDGTMYANPRMFTSEEWEILQTEAKLGRMIRDLEKRHEITEIICYRDGSWGVTDRGTWHTEDSPNLMEALEQLYKRDASEKV